MSKFVVAFIAVYFFIVLDPFNLNKQPFAVVLSGSLKYATLLLMLSMIITSVYIQFTLGGDKRWYEYKK